MLAKFSEKKRQIMFSPTKPPKFFINNGILIAIKTEKAIEIRNSLHEFLSTNPSVEQYIEKAKTLFTESLHQIQNARTCIIPAHTVEEELWEQRMVGDSLGGPWSMPFEKTLVTREYSEKVLKVGKKGTFEKQILDCEAFFQKVLRQPTPASNNPGDDERKFSRYNSL